MTRSDKTRFTRLLKTRRKQLLGEMDALREPLSVQVSGDPMDHARHLADRDVAVRNATRVAAVLRLVDAAMEAIGAGTYGVCASCENDIPAKRLQAVPWSAYCVECQEQFERGGGEEQETAYALAS